MPHVGAIVKTPEGVGEVDSVETLAERIKVKLKNGENYSYKKFLLKEIKVIKDTDAERVDEEEQKNKEELEKLERMEQEDKKGGESYGI